MNSKPRPLVAFTLLAVLMNAHVLAQGTFQNLDFEAATLIPIPGDPFGRVEFAPAFPGWVGYVGTNLQIVADHNNRSLSEPGIAIMGPDFPAPSLFQGHYYARLYTAPGVLVAPALAQTGLIPSAARSIRFLGGAQDVPFLSFASQSIPLSVLGSTSTYTIWGGDISSFAGQTGELRFQGSRTFDNISFSDQPIPEPSTFGLFGLGALVLGWRFAWRRKQSIRAIQTHPLAR